MKFGTRLHQIRKTKEIPLKTLAKKIRVNHSYLSRIETGLVQPSEHVIHKLATALGCDEAELMLLSNRIPPKWRSTIKKAPQETASLIEESIEEYKSASLDSENGNGLRKRKSIRKSPKGIPTNNLIFSAHMGTNDEIFPKVLSLYVKPGSKVADVTFGRGVFWKQIPKDEYELLATDIEQGVDCRELPYENNSIDCVVLDPPYMHTPGGTAHVGHQNFEGYYKNNSAGNGSSRKYHEAVLDLYFAAGAEALRILKNEGIFIVKCADEVCANQQRLTHVELINEYSKNGFVNEDLFVLLRRNRPGVSRMLRQVHARKNHSYFLVFRKSIDKRRWKGPSGLFS